MYSGLSIIDLSHDHMNELNPYAFVDFANLEREHRFWASIQRCIAAMVCKFEANEKSLSIFAMVDGGLRRNHYSLPWPNYGLR